MTVKELKKYIEVMDDNACLSFEFTDIDTDGDNYQRVLTILSVEISKNLCCFHGEE